MTEAASRWPQAALALGGVLWVGWSLVIFGTGTPDGSIRAVVGLSGLALAVGLLGFVLRLPWTYGFPGGEGAGIAMLGGLVFGLGQGLSVATGAGGSGVVEAVIGLGVLGLVGGTLLLAAGLVRTRRTPPWLGISLVVGTVLFLGFENGNGLQALLAIPLGLAWLGVGGYLLRYPEQPTEHVEPSAISR